MSCAQGLAEGSTLRWQPWSDQEVLGNYCGWCPVRRDKMSSVEKGDLESGL